MKVLIQNGTVITQNRRREIIHRGFIVVANDVIELVGEGKPSLKVLKNCQKTIDAKGLTIIPGLINAHVHLGESIFKFFLPEHINLARYLRATDSISKSSRLIENGREFVNDYSLRLLVKYGTSTICGGRVFPSAQRWGVRNVSGYMVKKDGKLEKFYHVFGDQFSREYEKIKRDQLSYPAIFIHSLNTVDRSKLFEIKEILNQYQDCRLTIHVAETRELEREIHSKWKMSSVRVLFSHGLLSKNTLIVHGNWLMKEDVRLIKNTQASLAHCLSSNLTVDDKTLNLPDILSHGINVCIATDGLVTSGNFNLLAEARLCYLYHNRFHVQKISAQKMFDCITINPARALGLDKEIGSIEVGKKADFAFIDIGDQVFATKRLIHDLIFYQDQHSIFGLMVNGRMLVWNGKSILKDKNDREIANKFRSIAERVRGDIKTIL